MIVAIASCPNPPLLLRGLTGRPVAEVEQLRTGCLAAIAELLAAKPDRVVMVGGSAAAELDPGRPLSILVGSQLLEQAGCALAVEHRVIAEDADPAECFELGRTVAGAAGRTALLVMADGSARRGLKAPGYLDDRAAPLDSQIEAALRNADARTLAGLDAALAADLLVAGRAAWQVLAGAAEQGRFDAELRYSDDPFGVWYPVVNWRPAGLSG